MIKALRKSKVLGFCKQHQIEPRCAYCGAKEKLTYDHIIPKSKGGGRRGGNILLSCVECNEKKKDMSVKDFLLKYRKSNIVRFQ